DFQPGVREELLSTRTRREAFGVLEVLRAVSGHIAGRFGATLDFTALLPDPNGDGQAMIPTGSRPFAEAAATLLAGLGGRYAARARSLVTALQTTTGPNATAAQDPDPFQHPTLEATTAGAASASIPQPAQETPSFVVRVRTATGRVVGMGALVGKREIL